MKCSWLDRAPLPTGVIRASRFVYANDALVTLVGAPRESIVGQHFLERVAPEDRARMSERHARRVGGEAVPWSYQFQLLVDGGSQRTVEIWVSSGDDGDVIFQLHDRTDRSVRQARLAALARLGVAVQSERTETAIHAAVHQGLPELDLAMVRLAPEEPNGGAETGARVLGASAPGGLVAQFEAAFGRPIMSLRGVWGEGAALAWREGSAYLDDMPLATKRFFEGATGQAALDFVHAAWLRRGVFLRIDRAGEPLELLLMMAAWLAPDDVPACRLFASQVSVALDAARVLHDVSGRNAGLAALNRIAVAAGSSRDLEGLFALGAEELAGVLACDAVAIFLIDEARDEAVLVHSSGGNDEVRRVLARVPLATTNLGLVAREASARVFHRDEYDEGRRAMLDRLGQRIVVSVPLMTRGKAIGVMNAAYREERTVGPREIELMQAAGALFAAAVEAQRLLADLRHSYAELARAQEQLVERERLAAIGELAAVVAHEVRNPLGVFFNSLGSLRKILAGELIAPSAGADTSAGTLLGIMDEEAMRLNHIVGDLLDFAKPTVPSLQAERLDQVLEEAVLAAVGDARDRIAIARHIDQLPPVPMDARLIRQALLNVAENAVHAMPSGGTMTLRLGRDAVRHAPMARIEIGDTGRGIEPDVEPRIFEPFFTTRATGTGLGLAVVKRIVDSHRGSLHVASSPGRGTTFVIWLPLDEEPTA